jgi:hypothetical protein
MVSSSGYRASYTAYNFPTTVLAKTGGELAFDDSDLAWALFTTARSSDEYFGPGDYLASFFEFLHRVSIVPAYLGRGSRIATNCLFEFLDRSEKVGVSYALGGAMSTIFSEQCLGVPGLLHVDRYAGTNNVVFNSPQRPDYLGIGRGGWVVVESKGRSRGFSRDLLTKLAGQKSAIQTIDGGPPWVRAGVVAHFGSGNLSVAAVDPPGVGPKAVNLSMDMGRFMFQYYRPFVRALERGDPIQTVENVTAVSFPAIGVEIGLHNEILSLVPGSLEESDREWASRLLERIGSGFDGVNGIKADGSYFATHWDDALDTADSRDFR